MLSNYWLVPALNPIPLKQLHSNIIPSQNTSTVPGAKIDILRISLLVLTTTLEVKYYPHFLIWGKWASQKLSKWPKTTILVPDRDLKSSSITWSPVFIQIYHTVLIIYPPNCRFMTFPTWVFLWRILTYVQLSNQCLQTFKLPKYTLHSLNLNSPLPERLLRQTPSGLITQSLPGCDTALF